MNSAHAQLTVTLVPSDFNGFNVKCFGGKSGAIDATVSGGIAPYTILWTSGQTTEDLTGIPAGYYKVSVYDANNLMADASITLTEPEALNVTAVPFKYPTGLNISCYECYNGSIDVTVTEGVPPYSYEWGDDVFTQDRSGLGPQNYQIAVIDANGCGQRSEPIFLKQPDSDDWKMGGNAFTDPNSQYIGTSDAQDVVFKSNGVEGLRLKNNGEISLFGGTTGGGVLYLDGSGTLRAGGPFEPPVPTPLCNGLSDLIPVWLTTGNDFSDLCPDQSPLLGTLTNTELTVITNSIERMRVTPTGLVGIGTTEPQDQLELHTTADRGGLRLVNSSSTANSHTEIRFMKKENGIANERWALGCDYEANGSRDFFIWNEATMGRSLFIDVQDRVAIGNVTFGNSTLYRLGVEGGIVCRDVKVTANAYPDFVFDAEYKLLSLDEVEKHISTKGHLPWFPTAAEVEEAGGIEVGDMQLRLLRTVEEQMLYILEMKEDLEAVKAEVLQLKNEQH